MKQIPDDKVTIVDRLAVAFLSAVISFVTATVIWFLAVVAFSFEGPYIFSSFKLVVAFTLLMAILGFLLLENFLATVLGRLWHFIVDYLKN